ncbi:MAG: hypothetical protein GY715_10605 [Planctomycetes bacterium]|nr:hypothetical protein [Planctomycetota bacterium]
MVPPRCVMLASSILVLGSCTAAPDGEAPSARDRDATATPTSRDVLMGSESGLRVRQWRVADEVAQMVPTLVRHADPDWPDPETRGRLARNGFRMVRVPDEVMAQLPAEIGGMSLGFDGWHGQVYEWRELAGREIEPQGRAVAIDGRVRRFGGGRLRLMMRGWTMQMEQGPRVYLELLPEYDRSRQTALDQMLGRRRFEGERFLDQTVDLLMEAGWAYALTCEAPGVNWNDDEAGGGSGTERVGPAVDAPPALGELLLKVPRPTAQRELIVFLPRIPDQLYPSDVTIAAKRGPVERRVPR